MRGFLSLTYVQMAFYLFVSMLIFWVRLEKRKHFFLRFFLGSIGQLGLSAIWSYTIYSTGKENFWIEVFMYFGFALLALFPAVICTKITFMEALFVLTGGYAVQHSIFSVLRIILYFFYKGKYVVLEDSIIILSGIYIAFVIGALFFNLLLKNKIKKTDQFQYGDIRIAILSVLIMFAAIGLSVYETKSSSSQGNPIEGIVCPIYGTLVCVLILWMCFGIFNEKEIEHEKDMMEQMIRLSVSQQNSNKEAIDIINIKCHDLKHQINLLKEIENSEERIRYLEEVKKSVSIYDAIYHTGNNALDYVLREKALPFNEKNIEFDCMADGSAIQFMASADVYALMGNALDNALESVLKEEEEERIISLQIKKKQEMVLIHLENSCSRNLNFKNGLPVTTKTDTVKHGFGVRSIRYIAEKYQGTVSMSLRNKMFCMDILFPIEQSNNT